MIARKFLLTGRVQGVGFRYFTQRVAARYQVLGYVRNLEDGRVEARYRAEYGWLFSFEFTLPMALEPALEGKEGCRFSGSADLGVRAGGVHTFDGHADGKTFTATYHAKEDYGAYEMERPQAGE